MLGIFIDEFHVSIFIDEFHVSIFTHKAWENILQWGSFVALKQMHVVKPVVKFTPRGLRRGMQKRVQPIILALPLHDERRVAGGGIKQHGRRHGCWKQR